MKKLLVWMLLAALLLAAGGCAPDKPEPVQPLSFYYRTAQTGYADSSGVLAAQIRDLGASPADAQTVLQLYFQGPTDSSLVSPFPKEVALLGVTRVGSELTVRLNSAYGTLTGINASIADACIAKTALQLSNVQRVRLVVTDETGGSVRETLLTAESIVLFDDSSSADTMELTLYFADSSSRYLLAEKRTVPYIPENRLPQYILEQLLAGPQTKGLYPTIPAGTSLLDISVENRICSVDLTAEFLANKPNTEQAERVTLLSLVNSLAELDSVDSVQLYIEGQPQQQYAFLDISGSFAADASAVGPVRPDLNELDTTLYLPSETDITLHAVPARVRLTSYESPEEAVLRELLNRTSGNGLRDVLPEGLRVLSVNVSEGLCTIDFNEVFSQFADENAERAGVRSIVASMTALEEVDAVLISVNGQPNSFTFLHVAGSLTPQRNWYVQPPQ